MRLKSVDKVCRGSKNVRDGDDIVHFGVILYTDEIASETLAVSSGIVLFLGNGRHIVALAVVAAPSSLTPYTVHTDKQNSF